MNRVQKVMGMAARMLTNVDTDEAWGSARKGGDIPDLK